MSNEDGMTWGEFKELVESKGVKEEDIIWVVDITWPISGNPSGMREVTVGFYDMGIQVLN